MEKKFNKLQVKLVKGDITEQETDAIVNAANNELWMGAGVAGAIKRKGGVEIEREAIAKGPIPIGEAVATTAGSLKAKYVIHAAGMGTDLRTNSAKIKHTTRNSLRRADELKLKSISFPAIGTGVGGFPVSRAAQVMFEAVKEHSQEEDTSLKTVIFVLFDQATYDAFEKELAKF